MRQGLSETCYVEQAGLELRGPLASAPRVLGLKVCATKSSPILSFYYCLLFRFLELTIISNLKNVVWLPPFVKVKVENKNTIVDNWSHL